MRSAYPAAVAALGGLAAEVLAVRAGVRGAPALLDLAAGWSLLAPAVLGTRLAPGCRALATLAGALWFVGTLSVLGGIAGRAGELWGSLYAAPLTCALLAAPGAWPPRRGDRAVALWLGVRGAIPALAAWDPATLASGVALFAAGSRGRRRRPAAAVAGFGTALAAGAATRLAGGDARWAETLVALAAAWCGAALLAAGRRPATTSLVVDLGRVHDAGSLERRLAEALGDPGLRLRYRLGADGGWLDAAGRPVAPPGESTVVEADGGVVAALLHDGAALDDERLRAAVTGAVRLAVSRLRLAADAAAHGDELAASRERLIAAAAAQRAGFAAEVRDGPGVELGRAAELLQAAAEEAPAALSELLRPALDELADARAELASALEGQGEDDLNELLTRLARRTGATADLRIGDDLPRPVASAAWFCASEAVANALKHAGGARIALMASGENGALVLEVSDDGPGGANPAGSGLGGLQARAQALGGDVRIVSPPGRGTRVRVELPLRSPG